MQQELIFWEDLRVQLQPADAHWNCHFKLREKPISRSLGRFGNIFIPQMPVPTLITRPKLILNAEPLVAIYMQVLVVLFNLPVHVSNYHNCSWSCCLCNLMGNISVLLYKQNRFLKTWKIKRHIRCAFLTTGEWLTIFWKYGKLLVTKCLLLLWVFMISTCM